jgi:hypothetical protein
MTAIVASSDPVLPLSTFNFLSLSTLSFKETFTMNKTHKTKTDSRRIEANRDHAMRLCDKVKFKELSEPLFDLHIDFDLTPEQDFQAPDYWISSKDAQRKHGLSSAIVNKMHFGSGTSLPTGVRDLHFRGTENACWDIIDAFSMHGEFRISKISVYSVESYDVGDDTDNDELRSAIQRFYKRKAQRSQRTMKKGKN